MIEMGKGIFNILDFGAVGDGKNVDTKAIQKAVDECAKLGGGIVLFPSGNYICGTVFLKDNVDIELQHACTVLINRDEDDICEPEELPYNPHADVETSFFRWALFMGQEVDNIAITGTGLIDGNGYGRGGPKPIALKSCSNVHIVGITIRNAPNYAISMLDCEYVTIDRVRIHDALADGIDPDNCRNVIISNCIVESHDDAICPKTSPALGKISFCANIAVSNCLLATNCNCFKLGTETSGDFRNISVSNCTMYPLGYGRAPTSGIALESVDGSNINGVAISNITMQGVDCPIFLRLGNRGRAQQVPTPGSMQNISITNIVAENAKMPSILSGIPGYRIHSVHINNINVNYPRIGAEDLDKLELGINIPENEDRYPDPNMFGPLPVSGWLIRHVEKCSMSEIRCRLIMEDPRSVLMINDCQELKWQHSVFDWSNAFDKMPPQKEKKGLPIVWVQNSEDLLFSDNILENYPKKGSSLNQMTLILDDLSKNVRFKESDFPPTERTSTFSK